MEDYDYMKSWKKIEYNSIYGSFGDNIKSFDDDVFKSFEMYIRLQKEIELKEKTDLRKKKLDSLF